MEQKTILKGLLVDVFRNGDRYDCTNGGLSGKIETFVLVSNNPRSRVFEADEKHPALILKSKNVGRDEYVYAEPAEPPKEGNVGWMMGGNFIYSSDSRFPSHQPIPVHDRQETPEQYRQLST